jgi:small subunit ribosomal protein S1
MFIDSIDRINHHKEVLPFNETSELVACAGNDNRQLALPSQSIDYTKAWEQFRQLQKEDATVHAVILSLNKGGALVEMGGLRGFIPNSHLRLNKSKEELVGEEFPLKFLEIVEERSRLILSHRRVLFEQQLPRLKQ